MSGSDYVLDYAKGAFVEKFRKPLANDNIFFALMLSSGLEADSVLRTSTDLADFVGGATNEVTDGSYSRQTAAGIVITVDTTNHRVDVDTDNVVFTALAGAAVAKLTSNYDDDTTGGTDANILTMTMHSFDVTPDTTDVTGTIANLARAS